MPPGEYFYFGIQEHLQLPNSKCFDPAKDVIKLSINIDALPAFKSGGKGFWPILARVDKHPVFLLAYFVL